ncbi:MAG TPA: hypothetical protein VGF95_04140 [Solirubrobacteraceae bacterium]|jgi:hypothetical protein
MPTDQPTLDPAEHYRQIELAILYHLTDPQDNQPLWSVDDLAREVDTTDIMAYVHPLQRSGLLHRTTDGHVFATRAAVRQIQLVGHGVI